MVDHSLYGTNSIALTFDVITGKLSILSNWLLIISLPHCPELILPEQILELCAESSFRYTALAVIDGVHLLHKFNVITRATA